MAALNSRFAITFALGSLLVLCLLILPGQPSQSIGNSPPRLMLWAWERPEDLQFIDSKTTGVAFLAGTIKIRKGKIFALDVRHQPLQVPSSTYLMSVLRIDSDGSITDQNDQLIKSIAVLLPGFVKPGVRAIQVDFDARKSERGWYRKFLTHVRANLPQGVYLSMTSLASWCLGDDWLAGLPVDEVVPMFFEMGSDSTPVSLLLQSGNTFGHSYQAIGISDKEPSINKLLGKMVAGILKPVPRVYMFSRRAWTAQKTGDLIKEVDSWK